MAKTTEVLQKPDENPADFYERLCEAFRIYTPFNPEAAEKQHVVNAAFVGQAQTDMRLKLQKLEGFAEKVPLTMGSDNGPAFVAEVVQQAAETLGIQWNLHTAYRPQSSGKVERMSWTLKQTMAKLCQETNLPWTDLLPMAPLWGYCTPGQEQDSPLLRSCMRDHPHWLNSREMFRN